jgi:pilus assembly protein Flp/PilA
MACKRNEQSVHHIAEHSEKAVEPIQLVLLEGQAAGGGGAARVNQGDKTMSKFLKLVRNSKGATAIEYGLIAALIAVAAIGAMQGIGNKLNTTFNNISNKLN